MKNNRKNLPKEYTFRHNLNGYLLIAPAVIAILALSVYPLVRGIIISFLNYDMTRANDPLFGTFAGLKNYAVVFSNAKYRQSVSNSILWTIVNLIAQVGFALIVALVLNEKLKAVCLSVPG